MRFALLLFLCCAGCALVVHADDWSLEIIPTYKSTQEQTIDTRGSAFVVLLTNHSGHDATIWANIYSWGYDDLSFLVTRADGKTFSIKRKQEMFTVNFPVCYLIRSGGHYAWSVTFSPDLWEGFPSDWKGEEKITLKAIFEIKPTPQSKEMKVWTGRVESPQTPVTLVRFKKEWYLKIDRSE